MDDWNVDGGVDLIDQHQGGDCRVLLADRKGGDMAEWPWDLRVRQFPAVSP